LLLNEATPATGYIAVLAVVVDVAGVCVVGVGVVRRIGGNEKTEILLSAVG
jgi:hypothetical protein